MSSHFLLKSRLTVDAPAVAAATLKAPQWAKQFSMCVFSLQFQVSQARFALWSKNMPVERSLLSDT